MHGILTNETNKIRTIEVNIFQCKWAIGRILFLISSMVVWLLLGIFFLIAAIQPMGSIGGVVFSIIFFVAFLSTFIVCIAAFGSETVSVTKSDLIFAKNVVFFTWRKHIKRDRIQAIVLGHITTPGENVSSIETVSVIYKSKSTDHHKNLIIGYLLDRTYRKLLYDKLIDNFNDVTI